MTRTFTKNKKGLIEFTETELKKLLDEVYNSGYYAGKGSSVIWTSPYYTYYCNSFDSNSGTVTLTTPSSTSDVTISNHDYNTTTTISNLH